MKVQTGWRKAGVVRRATVLGLCFALFSIQPTLGGAAVVTQTFSAAGFSFSPPVTSLYDYTAGTPTTWTDAGDFDAGTYVNTNGTDVPGAVVLNRIGPNDVVAPDPAIAWWDTDWTNRRCYELDHTAAGAASVTEYQLRLPFPIDALTAAGFLQADLGDLRAIGTDGATSLPVWPDDVEPDTVWVQVDSIAATATSDICLYHGYGPGTATSPANHTEAAVFSYTAAKDIYYAVSDFYVLPGGDVNVVSFTDGNQVTRSDGTSIVLSNSGDLGTFAAVDNTPGTVFSVLGPIGTAGIGDGADTLVPISFAGTAFVAPITRDAQQFSFVAPFGDAAVDLYDGASLVASFTVLAGTPYTHAANDITAGNTAIIESDLPVLVTHRSDLSGDGVPLYPATSGDYYAVRSQSVLVGFDTDASQVDVFGSDGAVGAAAADRGDAVALGGGASQGGAAGDGLLLSTDEPIGVISHDDGDGNESTLVLPATELGSQYWAPTSSQYTAMACPTAASADVALTISPPGLPDRPVTCAGGPDVAWAADVVDLTVTTTGISISSDDGSVFAAYYEDLATDDEIGLYGMKQGRQYTWPEPIVTVGETEGIYESTGTWESATVDTGVGTGIFGEVGLTGSTPGSTTLRIQIATAASGTPTDFVGPDGTSATYFEQASLPAVADFDHDGERLLRVRAELTTSDPVDATPQLDLVVVEGQLPELDRSLAGPAPAVLTTTIDPVTTTSYLLRVKTSDPTITGSQAGAVYRSATNLANLAEETVRFVNRAAGVDSVQQSNTQPTDPPELFQTDRPHSVVLDHAAVGSGTTSILFAWRLDYGAGGSIFIETDFAVEVTAP